MTASARLALARVARTPRALVLAALWSAVALVAAAAERSHAWPEAEHVLVGAFGAIALPLFVYVVVGASLAGKGLGPATQPLVAFGADPARVAGGALAVSAATSAVATGLLSALVTAIAHGPSDPPVVRDALTAAWIGALAAVAYAAFFTFGAALSRGGAGRSILLAVDWVFGAGDRASALLTPRGHTRNLLGGAPPVDLSQRASATALVLLAIAYGGCALLLARRRR